MTKEKTIEVLNLFKAQRYRFDEYYKVNDYVYTTDGYTGCRVNAKFVEDLELESNKTPSFEDIFILPEKSSRIDIDKDLLLSLKTVPILKDEIIECNECDGEGEVYWNYESYDKLDDCPVCRGNGEVKNEDAKPTGGFDYGEAKVSVKGKAFNARLIERLLKVKDIVGGNIKHYKTDKKNKADLFKIGYFTIIIMPISHYEKDELINIIK